MADAPKPTAPAPVQTKSKKQRIVDAQIVSSGTMTPAIPASGTNTNTTFQPCQTVGVMDILSSSNPLVSSIVNQHVKNGGSAMSTGRVKTGNPALDLAQEVIERFNSGGDLADLREKVDMLAANSQEKAELVTSLMASADNDMVVKLESDNAYLYGLIHAAIHSGQLTVPESLAAHEYLQALRDKTRRRVEEASQDQSKNLLEIVDKTGYNRITVQKELEKKFSNTTPQGREILRKLAYRATRIVTEQITTTTRTVQETAEPVQPGERQVPKEKPKSTRKKKSKPAQ